MLLVPLGSICIYKTLLHYRKDISMAVVAAAATHHTASDVLCSTSELDKLSHEWSSYNRARVYAKKVPADGSKHHCIPPGGGGNGGGNGGNGGGNGGNGGGSRVLQNSAAAAAKAARAAEAAEAAGTAEAERHTRVMAVIERKLIMTVCDSFLARTPPYYRNAAATAMTATSATASATTASAATASVRSSSRSSGTSGISSGISSGTSSGSSPPSVHRNTAHSCCAHVTTAGIAASRRVHLPMAVPSHAQIAKCEKDACYNRNVLLNLTKALASEHIPVLFSSTNSGSGSSSTTSGESAKHHGTVHMHATTCIKALGDSSCCGQLLFGTTRTTCSPGFSIGSGLGSTYAEAVRHYQQHNNVSVGEHVTLVPTFRKRPPMVVSMSCPQLHMSEIATGVSVDTPHTKFGHTHTTQAVEVLKKLAPFVTGCSQACMPDLSAATLEHLREHSDMPVPVSSSVEHCFAHNTAHGVSAYAATHVFSLPTAILNSYASASASASAWTAETPFPLEQTITVHVAALFGGPPSGGAAAAAAAAVV
jgi:hypothetical protein